MTKKHIKKTPQLPENWIFQLPLFKRDYRSDHKQTLSQNNQGPWKKSGEKTQNEEGI